MIVNMISESEYFTKGHGVHTAFINIVDMLREKGVEVWINSRQKTDIIHIHTIGPYSLYKTFTNNPVVISAHVIPSSFIGSLKGSQYWLPAASVYLRIFYNRADLVLAVAPKVKDELIKIGVQRRIGIFPNPINQKIFKEDAGLREAGRQKIGVTKSDFVVLGVGQIQPRKGFDDFWEVAKNLPKIKFVWSGGKPFKQFTASSKETKIGKNQPQNLSIAGPFGYENMPSIYNAADVFFLPSYQENAPMAVIEAGSCGLPLVLRDLTEYKVLYHEGYLAASTNPSFRAAILGLYDDKKLYKQVKEEGRNLSIKFSFDMQGDSLIQYYQGLLK